MAAFTCGLSLEAYLQLYKALTKHSNVVQSVTPIEECYYKMQDLKHLLLAHGITSSKFNRAELLQALKGKHLINPVSINTRSICSQGRHSQPQPACPADAASDTIAGNSSTLLFSATDLVFLGWAEEGSGTLSQQLEHLQLTIPAAQPGADLSEPTACRQLAAATAASPAGFGCTRPDAAQARRQHTAATSYQQHTGAGTSALAAAAATSTQHAAYNATSVANLSPHETAALAGKSQIGSSSALQQEKQQEQADPASNFKPASAQPGPTQLCTAPAVARLGAALATHGVLQPGQLLPASTSSLPAPDSRPAVTEQQAHSQTGGCHQEQQHGQVQQQQEQPPSNPAQQQGTAAGSDHQPLGNRLLAEMQPARLHGSCLLPGNPHARWLQQQLQLLVTAGAVASAEQLPASAACAGDTVPPAAAGPCSGVLLGRGVGFVLLEDMQVAGPKSSLLMLPAGVYQVRMV